MRSIRTVVVAGVLACGAAALAADLNPPLRGMKGHTTKDGSVHIEFPDHTERATPEKLPGSLDAFTVWIQNPKPGQNPDLKFDVMWEMQFGRMGLARHMLDRWKPGKVAEGGLREGADWYEEHRTAPEQALEAVTRYFEHAGVVIGVRILVGSQTYPHVKDHISAILDTVKVLKRPEDRPYAFVLGEMEIDGARVHTNVDKKLAKTFVKVHARGWAAARKTLDGEYFHEGPPLLVICARSQEYDDLAVGTARQNKTRWAYVHSHRHAAVVNADGWKKEREDAEQELEYVAITQALQEYFGGQTPDWIELGLSQYIDAGLDAGGKPKKPKKSRVKDGREAFLAADRPLNELFDVRAGNDHAARLAFHFEAWTWHYYLRHGSGAKTYGKPYQRQIELLRETGDPLKARAAWDGVDFAKMHADAVKWAGKWK